MNEILKKRSIWSNDTAQSLQLEERLNHWQHTRPTRRREPVLDDIEFEVRAHTYNPIDALLEEYRRHSYLDILVIDNVFDTTDRTSRSLCLRTSGELVLS